MFKLALLIAFALSGIARPELARAQDHGLEGAWTAEVYRLKSGPAYPVRGHIFFGQSKWQVVFFVMDGDEAQRGSAEGGSYEIAGERLTFQHHYVLAAGNAMPGLPASPLRMEARDGTGPDEPTQVTLSGSRLTLQFPSGNSMEFSRPF